MSIVQRQEDQREVDVNQTEPTGRDPELKGGVDALAKAQVVAKKMKGGTPSVTATGLYSGLTWPESVAARIAPVFKKEEAAWQPRVKKLTGQYSIQTRVQPGQFEITEGSTTEQNYCRQVQDLELGSVLGTVWVKEKATLMHEKVHAKRALPALKEAAPDIMAEIEAVRAPDFGLTKAEATTALVNDSAYLAALNKAQSLWLAAFLIKVDGDHRMGGPTEEAEQKVNQPVKKRICKLAKTNNWPPCDSC